MKTRTRRFQSPKAALRGAACVAALTGFCAPAAQASMPFPSGLFQNPVDLPTSRLASISSIFPTRGLAGTRVVVSGTNLQSTRMIQLGATSIEPATRSAGSVSFVVPEGAVAGSVSVVTEVGVATSTQVFEVVQPAAQGFSPASGPVGTRIIVRGVGLEGATHVRFNNVLAPVEGASYTQASVRVPSGATSGAVSVIVAGKEPRAVGSFTVSSSQTAPVFTGFSPASGPIGSVVRLAGSNLSAVTEVRFNNVVAPFTTVSPMLISATLPAGATTGAISLRWSGGVVTRPGTFTVTASNAAVGSLLGRVQNPAGAGIGNVTVLRINKTNPSDLQQAVSDEAGNFSFPNVQPGVYQVAPFARGVRFTPLFQERTVSTGSVALAPFVGTVTNVTHPVTGRVVRQTPNTSIAPIAGARVLLYGNSNPRSLTFDRLLWVTSTDDTGTYRFPSVPVDLYVVRVEKSGYAFSSGGRSFLPIYVNAPVSAAPFVGVPLTSAPANDAFAAARILPGTSGTTSAVLTGATREVGEPSHGPGVPATSSVWFKWTAPASGRVTFSTQSTLVHDTVLAAYTGTSLAALTQIAANDDITSPLTAAAVGTRVGNTSSTVQFEAVAGRAYFLALDGKFASVSGSVNLKWKMPSNDAYLDAQVLAGAQGVTRGSNLGATREAFEPTSSGARSVWYVWVAPSAGTATFTTANSSFDTTLDAHKYLPQSGTLSLVARNDNESASTRHSRVSFATEAGAIYVFSVDGARPPGAATGATGNITLGWSFVAEPLRLSLSIESAFSESVGPVRGIVSRSVASPSALAVRLSSSNTTQATVPAAVEIPAGATSKEFLLSPVNDESIDGDQRVTISASATGAVSAFTVVTIADDDQRPVGPANDNRENAQFLSGISGSLRGSNVGASREDTDQGDEFYGRSVWFTWTAPSAGQFSFTTTGSSIDTTLTVLSYDAAADSYSTVGSNTNTWNNVVTSNVTFTATAGVTYFIAVDGNQGAQGAFTLNWGSASGTP